MQKIVKDFQNRKISVELSPKFSMSMDESTGEIKPKIIENDKVRKKLLTIIVDPDGKALEPHNSYLHNLLSTGAKNTNTAAQALLSFTRYLTAINKTYRDVTDDQYESPPWLYGDWLLDTLTVVDPATGKPENNNGYSISTARTYMGVVIGFYKWLHRENILAIDNDHKPFEFKWVRINRGGMVQHNMLAHITGRKAIEVQTNNLIKRFPKVQSTPPWMKLKPLKPDDKALFLKYLNKEKGAGEVKSLMCRFALETGVRMQELVTIPEDKIVFPIGDIDTPFTIGPANGCDTKFSKQRNIGIPYELMIELHEYKLSRYRVACLNRAGLELNKQEQQSAIKSDGYVEPVSESRLHGRLFINEDGRPYSKNTIQSFISTTRKQIRNKHGDWYYRPHDLRSTFATEWLGEEVTKRKVVYDFLMQELAVLMGHENISTTLKYIDFMNATNTKIEHSASKNKVAKQALQNTRS
jgi:integrase